MTEPFRLRFAAGVTPDKWLRTWAARMPGTPVDAAVLDEGDDPSALLRAGTCSIAFVRLPVDRTGLHVIPLYEEVPVVVAAREHPVAAFDELDVADLADENLLQSPGEVPEWAAVATDRPRPALGPMTVQQAVAVAASGAGVLIVPLSVARLHHRKDVVHRPVTGVTGSRVGLAWRADDEDPRIETFIGIVRGRTERSSRGGTGEAGTGANGQGRTGTEPKDGKAGKQAGRAGPRARPGRSARRRPRGPGRPGGRR
ncbi:LysR substrate-binding domain-containing protein [Georgenia sp. SUBG003]|uniref:LysR substrate-binding domain-containing protein n=1 Tax=Georgenia sp. SUBG003 TaxID=1497974 RepID=UPI0004D4AC4D|nr:LysR family transcriptional regulator [Georgenia sp. SUBG003]